MDRGRLPQRAGLLGLNGGGAAATVRDAWHSITTSQMTDRQIDSISRQTMTDRQPPHTHTAAPRPDTCRQHQPLQPSITHCQSQCTSTQAVSASTIHGCIFWIPY